MAKIKNSNSTKSGEDVEELNHLYTAGGNEKLMQSF